MGKRKSGTTYTSKGERPNVSKKNLTSPSEVSYLDRYVMAMKSWEKGSPCPKIIQASMGIGPKALYKNHVKSIGGK